MRIDSSGTLIHKAAAVFNEDGGNSDFRVESDTRSAMFFVDASTDRVGINTDAPQQTLEVRGKMLIESNNGGLMAAANYRFGLVQHRPLLKMLCFVAIKWYSTKTAMTWTSE
jgi:hypothetical protein